MLSAVDVSEGRAMFEAVFAGPLVVTPVDDHDGSRSVHRFHFSDRTMLGEGPRQPGPVWRGQPGASPTGFEPVLAA